MPLLLVDVIVPVLDRPQNAAPFVEALRATETDRVRLIVVTEVDDVDTREAWEAAIGADDVVLTTHFVRTFAEKVNTGYRFSSAPWVLLAGDDVRFTPGWLDAALEVAESTGAKVIGTNDEVNRRVTKGAHTCHPMIARDYIDEVGASWDGPGVVCHEGYRHCYVDDEIVSAAKRRGVWAMAFDAKLRHLHPVWGTAPTDATYRLGQRSVDADRALFKERASAH